MGKYIEEAKERLLREMLKEKEGTIFISEDRENGVLVRMEFKRKEETAK